MLWFVLWIFSLFLKMKFINKLLAKKCVLWFLGSQLLNMIISDFHVASQNPKVGWRRNIRNFRNIWKSQNFTKWLEMVRQLSGNFIWVLERWLSVRVAFDVCALPFRGPQRCTPCLEAALPWPFLFYASLEAGSGIWNE